MLTGTESILSFVVHYCTFPFSFPVITLFLLIMTYFTQNKLIRCRILGNGISSTNSKVDLWSLRWDSGLYPLLGRTVIKYQFMLKVKAFASNFYCLLLLHDPNHVVANFFCKRSHGKHFRLCRPPGVCRNYSAQLQTICKQMSTTTLFLISGDGPDLVHRM